MVASDGWMQLLQLVHRRRMRVLREVLTE